jgi:hypothetical protein
MPETARCYRTDLMGWPQALRVVAHQGAALQPLIEAGLRIRLLKTDAQFIIPSPHHDPFAGNAAMLASFTALCDGLALHGTIFSPKRSDASSINLDQYAAPQAVLAVIAAAIAAETDNDTALSLEVEHFALAVDEDVTSLAAAAGSVIWQAPGVRLEAATESGPAVFFQFANDPQTVAAASAFYTSGRHEGFHLLDAYHCGALRLLVPRARPTEPRRRLSQSALEAFGKALAAFATVGSQQGSDAMAVLAPQSVWTVRLPASPSARTIADFAPENEDEIEVVSRTLKPESEALAVLERIWSKLPKAGHRLELRPVPATAEAGEKPDQLMERIRALQRKHALSLALQAPQLRLLRFSARQPVAMVEALRTMPPQTIDQGTIRYGFHSSDADPLGSHYLAWSTDEVGVERPFEEHFLRGQTEDRPITYWLDPAWAKFYDDQGGRVRSRIMVPYRYRLSPTLHAFRSRHENDMDLFLRKRFADGTPLPANEQPIYLVSPSTSAGFSHTVETLDFNTFHPFRTQLPWVSNVLEILASNDLREVIAEAADTSRRRALLDGLRARNAQDRQTLEDATTELVATLGKRLSNYLGGLSREVDALSAHISGFVELMDQLTAESAQAERYVTAIIDSATDRAERIARIAAESQGLAVDRKTINEGLVRAVTTTDAFVGTVRARLEKAEAELEQLRSKLDWSAHE